MLHINTHFFPRWIYGTRRSLTKLCVRHYIMRSAFEMYLFHCKDLVLVFGLSFCNKYELKRWSISCSWYLYISRMVPKFSGFLSKKNSGGSPGTNSSQRPKMSRVCFQRKISFITLMILFLKSISDHFEHLYLEWSGPFGFADQVLFKCHSWTLWWRVESFNLIKSV